MLPATVPFGSALRSENCRFCRHRLSVAGTCLKQVESVCRLGPIVRDRAPWSQLSLVAGAVCRLKRPAKRHIPSPAK